MGDRPRKSSTGVRPAPGPRPLGGLADLADLMGGESDRSRRFLGGLVAGALVGAAIVGTAAAAIARRRGEDRDRD